LSEINRAGEVHVAEPLLWGHLLLKAGGGHLPSGILGNRTEHSRLNVWPDGDRQEQCLLPSLTHGDTGLREAGLSKFI